MAPQPQPALPPTGAPARLGLPSGPPNVIPNGGIALLSHTHGSNAGPDIILHLPAPARRDSLPVYGSGDLKFATSEELKGFWKLGKNAALHLTVGLFGELAPSEETALVGLMADWIVQSLDHRQPQHARADTIRAAKQYLVGCGAGGRITRAVFWDGKPFAFAVFKPAQGVLLLERLLIRPDVVASAEEPDFQRKLANCAFRLFLCAAFAYIVARLPLTQDLHRERRPMDHAVLYNLLPAENPHVKERITAHFQLRSGSSYEMTCARLALYLQDCGCLDGQWKPTTYFYGRPPVSVSNPLAPGET